MTPVDTLKHSVCLAITLANIFRSLSDVKLMVDRWFFTDLWDYAVEPLIVQNDWGQGLRHDHTLERGSQS
jgi:hypothetical protein